MRAVWACAVAVLLSGCAAQGRPAADLAPADEAPVAGEDFESFEQYIRRRAGLALDSVDISAAQKEEVDDLLVTFSEELYACAGGTRRRMLKTLSILASSGNQAQALDALEKADIPLSGKCLMLGSDLITQFSETLTESQRQALVAGWQESGTAAH